MSHEVLSAGTEDLARRLLRAEAKLKVLRALLRLAFALIRVLGVRVDERMPDGGDKGRVLRAIARAQEAVPLRIVLALTGLSAARYHAWRRASLRCALDDRPSCPRVVPTRITCDEIHAIRDLVTDPAYRHFSIRGLAMYATRIGRVFVLRAAVSSSPVGR